MIVVFDNCISTGDLTHSNIQFKVSIASHSNTFFCITRNYLSSKLMINAIFWFGRLREADKRTVFSVLKKSERDKKKLMETVLRQLKQLLQSST